MSKQTHSIAGKKVMVAGHFCLDITPRFSAGKTYTFEKVFSPGRLTNIEEPTISLGGPVSNTGIAMAKLGADVQLNGKIGDDVFGNLIEQIIGKEKTAAFKKVPHLNTSYTIVLALPGYDRFFLHSPGSNDTFNAGDIDYEKAGRCELFHFGYPPLMQQMYENDGKELVTIFKHVKELGVTTSLDMAMPDPASKSGQVDWKVILENVLPYVDIFLPSLEEIVFMIDRELFEKNKELAADTDPVSVYSTEDCSRISSKLLSQGAKIVAIKCGYRGVYLRTGNKEKLHSLLSTGLPDYSWWHSREIWAQTYKAENFKSALGAGDATIAGFLCGLMAGLTPEETLKAANLVGWQNVQEYDTLSGIHTWGYTMELLEKQSLPQNPAGIDSPGWYYSKERQVYYGPNDLMPQSSAVIGK
ncbi:MAG: carbohydrate kinase family protein [Spirochaetota bacterium]